MPKPTYSWHFFYSDNFQERALQSPICCNFLPSLLTASMTYFPLLARGEGRKLKQMDGCGALSWKLSEFKNLSEYVGFGILDRSTFLVKMAVPIFNIYIACFWVHCFGTIWVENELVLPDFRRGIFLHEPQVVHDASEAPPDRPLVLAEVLCPFKEGILARIIWVHGDSCPIITWQF